MMQAPTDPASENAVLQTIEEVIQVNDAVAYAVREFRSDPSFHNAEVFRTATDIRVLFDSHPELLGVVWQDETGMKAFIVR